MTSRRTKIFLLWLFIWLITTGLAAFVINRFFSVDWLVLFLAAVNLSAFFLYGWDKLSAGQRIDRVPEVVLYFSVLCGGGVGALLGMDIFHHKTKKISFQFVVAVIILVQLGLLFLLNQKFNLISFYVL